jgi:hypothetical protein
VPRLRARPAAASRRSARRFPKSRRDGWRRQRERACGGSLRGRRRLTIGRRALVESSPWRHPATTVESARLVSKYHPVRLHGRLAALPVSTYDISEATGPVKMPDLPGSEYTPNAQSILRPALPVRAVEDAATSEQPGPRDPRMGTTTVRCAHPVSSGRPRETYWSTLCRETGNIDSRTGLPGTVRRGAAPCGAGPCGAVPMRCDTGRPDRDRRPSASSWRRWRRERTGPGPARSSRSWR